MSAKKIQSLKDNEKAITNLTKALSDGRVTDIIYTEIEKKQAENRELEKQTAIEKAIHLSLTIDQVKFFINRFKNGNINDINYRRSLIDTFINKIYLYDNKMTILYNVQDSQSDLTFNESGSPRVTLVEARRASPYTCPYRGKRCI